MTYNYNNELKFKLEEYEQKILNYSKDLIGETREMEKVDLEILPLIKDKIKADKSGSVKKKIIEIIRPHFLDYIIIYDKINSFKTYITLFHEEGETFKSDCINKISPESPKIFQYFIKEFEGMIPPDILENII